MMMPVLATIICLFKAQGRGKEEVGPLDGPALPARIGHNVRVGIVADIGSPLPRGTNDESLLVEGELYQP